MVSRGENALRETSMICLHDHRECDNRGCRYGGCQGRPSGVVAHKDPSFRKNASASKARMAEPCQLLSLIRQQVPGRAPGNYVAEGCPEHAVEFNISGGSPCPYSGPCLGFNPRPTPPILTISSSLCLQSDEVFRNVRKNYI